MSCITHTYLQTFTFFLCWQNYLWRVCRGLNYDRVDFKSACVYLCQFCRWIHSVRQQKHPYAIHERIHSTNWRKFFSTINLD